GRQNQARARRRQPGDENAATHDQAVFRRAVFRLAGRVRVGWEAGRSEVGFFLGFHGGFLYQMTGFMGVYGLAASLGASTLILMLRYQTLLPCSCKPMKPSRFMSL